MRRGILISFCCIGAVAFTIAGCESRKTETISGSLDSYAVQDRSEIHSTQQEEEKDQTEQEDDSESVRGSISKDLSSFLSAANKTEYALTIVNDISI